MDDRETPDPAERPPAEGPLTPPGVAGRASLRRTGVWVAIGVALGAALGAVFGSVAFGVAFGLGLGAVIGVAQASRGGREG